MCSQRRTCFNRIRGCEPFRRLWPTTHPPGRRCWSFGISEPDRGRRHWTGKAAARKAVYANRRRIRGARGHRLLRQRGELQNFRKAWVITVLRTHGVKPKWRKKGGYRHLTLECLDAFQAINLHWHDLRHEYASRLVERGVPLAQVRDLLGHASITTTERYDNQTLEALQAATERLEDGKRFDATASSRGTKFQESFKVEPHADAQTADGSDANSLTDWALMDGSVRGIEPRSRG